MSNTEMQPMSQSELEQMCQHLDDIMSGAQLQEVFVNDGGLLLQFYLKKSIYLLIDLSQQCPLLLDFDSRPVFTKGKPKPVALFLNSHGVDLIWKAIVLKPEYGRVLEIHLGNRTQSLIMELRLIPRQTNLILESEGRRISWHKPKDLEMHSHESAPPLRTVDVIRQEYLARQQGARASSADPIVRWENQKAKTLQKKMKALQELLAEVNSAEEEKWRRLGQWLQFVQGECPEPELYKRMSQLSLSQQIQASFDRAKQIVQKRQGQVSRIEILKKEISNLESQKFQPEQRDKPRKDMMVAAQATGRTLEVSVGIKAYLGKSAADNLKLLRRARAWDLWFHLKDFPGAHAIVHMEKEQELSFSEIQKVAQWVARESLQKKALLLGQKFAVVVVECRFVRPIKGDRLGRVHYHSEKTYYVTL